MPTQFHTTPPTTRPAQRLPAFLLALSFLLGCLNGQGAEIVELRPIADTSLIEYAPTNNMGAQPFINAGSTANLIPLRRNRALIRFDLSSVPSGSEILSAQLHAEMNGEPNSGGSASLFSLHRMLRPWGEGNKVSGGGGLGLGSPATADEATWLTPFHQTEESWSLPGGEADVDFVANVSSTHFIEDPPPYSFTFNSTEDMVADVQLWVQSPEQNLGWMLRSLAEGTLGTARRFGSREDSQNAPRLVVEFEPPPRFDAIRLIDAVVELHFRGLAGRAYAIEHASMLPAQEWTELETIEPLPADMTVIITDTPQGSFRVYRIVELAN